MSISSTTRKAGPYLGNGSTTVFSFTFKVFQASDLKVILTDTAGVDSTLILGANYTVSLNANQDTTPGGSVTLLAAPPSGAKVTLTSAVPILQPMVLTNSGGFYPEVLNDSADRQVIIAQQQQDQLDRAITIPITTGGVSTEAPKPEANKVLAWNAAGTGLQNVDAATLATIAAYGTSRIDAFTGDGVTVNYALSASPGAIGNLAVFIGGLIQAPTADYVWVSGTTLTFTSPPPNGSRILVRYAQALPSGGSVDAGNVVGLQEAVEDYIGNAITAGANITVSYDDTTGRTTISSTGGGGTSNAVNFVTAYGGNGDGSTNNDAAIALAEASAYEVIWLPEGRYVATVNRDTLAKKYVGPGVLIYSTGSRGVQNIAAYAANISPTASTWEYGVNATKMTFTDYDYRVVAAGTRRNFDRYMQSASPPNGFSTYFWAPATAKFSWFKNKGGSGGASGYLSAAVSAGATTAQITGGVADWASKGLVGLQLGFTSAPDGIPTDIVTVTAASGSTITFTPALVNAYPAGSVVSHGYRTMNPHELKIVEHTGGGDSYAWCARVIIGCPPLDSQKDAFIVGTGGIIGGDMTFTQNGNYATGWECQYIDQNFDCAAIGRVESYTRQNNNAAWVNNVWLHDYAKMDGGGTGYAAYGLKPIDGVYVAAVAAKVGLDFSRSAFSVAAIALPLGQRIGFDAEIVSPGAANGWGFVATGVQNMFIRGNSDLGGKFLALTNDTASIIIRPTVIQASAPLDVGTKWFYGPQYKFADPVTLTEKGQIITGTDGTGDYIDWYAGSTYRFRLRPNGTANYNGTINAATNINAGASLSCGAADPKVIFIQSSGVYIYWDGSNLRATKNGGASSVIIV